MDRNGRAHGDTSQQKFSRERLDYSNLLTLGTAVNVAGQYNYTPDSKQVITFAILLAFLVLVSLLPKEEKHAISWKRIVPKEVQQGLPGVVPEEV